MKLSLSRPTLAACAVAGLFATAPVSAQEAQGTAWVSVINVSVFDTDLGLGSDGNYRFYDNANQVRGLTTVFEDSLSDIGGAEYRQTVIYSVLPSLPVTSDALSTSTGSAYGNVNGLVAEAGLTLLAVDRYGEGYAGVSTTANGSLAAGFWNLILAPHTGVVIDASSFAEALLRDRCLTTCGEVYAAAALLAQFAPESLVNPGLPDLDLMVTRRASNVAFLDGANITGGGGLLQTSLTKDLHLVFENLSDQEVFGRVRWDSNVVASSAVPEPGIYALMGLGLALLALRRHQRG